MERRGVRDRVELAILRVEAERRVRAGQSRAEAARALGLPLSTLAQWAQAGGWRRADIERERASEVADATALRVGEARERETAGWSTPGPGPGQVPERRLDPRDDPANPDRTQRDRAARELEALVARLERELREEEEEDEED